MENDSVSSTHINCGEHDISCRLLKKVTGQQQQVRIELDENTVITMGIHQANQLRGLLPLLDDQGDLAAMWGYDTAKLHRQRLIQRLESVTSTNLSILGSELGYPRQRLLKGFFNHPETDIDYRQRLISRVKGDDL